MVVLRFKMNDLFVVLYFVGGDLKFKVIWFGGIWFYWWLVLIFKNDFIDGIWK